MGIEDLPTAAELLRLMQPPWSISEDPEAEIALYEEAIEDMKVEAGYYDLPQVSETAQKIYDIISEHGPITGPRICDRYPIGESTLTKYIIPELRAAKLIAGKDETRRRVGYRLP